MAVGFVLFVLAGIKESKFSIVLALKTTLKDTSRFWKIAGLDIDLKLDVIFSQDGVPHGDLSHI